MSIKLLLVVGLLSLFALVLRINCGDLCGEDVQVGAGDRHADAVSVAGQEKVVMEWRDSGRMLSVALPSVRCH